VALLLVVLALAFIGPFLGPQPIDKPIGVPAQGPGGGLVLGTDALGRDVFSRLLAGGASVIGLGVLATVLSYAVGMSAGLVAGYSRSWIDPFLMRSVDVLLSFPALLLLLLMVTGLGNSLPVLVLGVVLIQLPSIARIVRTATQEVAVRAYVEAAVARGESTPAILRREVLPNIRPVLLADVGLRFGFSILLIASVNYLGFGLQPPAADWGLTISQNQSIVGLNPWAVLAPAIPLAALTVGVNLIADAYSSTSSGRRRSPRSAKRRVSVVAAPASS
jgi:ABC-type dipeptide/oligopeptide/nickel transport system permease subunit